MKKPSSAMLIYPRVVFTFTRQRWSSTTFSIWLTFIMRLSNIISHFSLLPSVADPGCLSRIPDPKTSTKERGEKKFVVPFSVATNFTKLKIILVLKRSRKIFGPVFLRILELFTQKFATKL
jgi:hypothetical protein